MPGGKGQKEALFEIARRTFDTPEFRGITFIEAECKTIINRVPGNALPFSWTINPYRGCAHACSYCTSPDTPVLMADGTTRRIADVRVGDMIYGTERRGTYRRYVKTQVEAHWWTMKPAYRVRLEDGTALIASGDHRFLSNRGWKHVTGAEHGPEQRPFLTTNNRLIGTGAFAETPKHDQEYMLGYLCGVIQGDGTIGSYTYARPNGTPSTVHRFRLALTDVEALERARFFLGEFDVPTDLFDFPSPGAPMHAIRTSRKRLVDAVAEIVQLPDEPSENWDKGFLAGIFDAEGSYGDVVRIPNTDASLIHRIVRALERLGFEYTIEDYERLNGLRCVRILGGLRENLRFFLTVDPAISRKRDIEGRALKMKSGGARVTSIEALGFEMPMVDITTGTGDFIANGIVSHNCFARSTHTFLDMNAGRDFETQIVVKVNAPEVLRAQLRSTRWHGEHVAMGTGTDPYQRAEGRYKLMPRIIQALIDYRNPFSILSKGTLMLRDIDLLQDAAKVAEVSTAFSIGTLDEDVWRKTEPGTPHPKERVKAVRALIDAGIDCSVLIAPILPGISDRPEQIKDVVRACIDAGATSVSPILLHLRPVVREHFMGWLGETYPDLVPRYEQMYARSPYAPSTERNALSARVGREVRDAGGVRAPYLSHRGSRPANKPRAPKQMKLL